MAAAIHNAFNKLDFVDRALGKTVAEGGSKSLLDSVQILTQAIDKNIKLRDLECCCRLHPLLQAFVIL